MQTQNSFSLLYIILLVIDLGCVILKRKMMLREIQMIILIGFSLCLYFVNVENQFEVRLRLMLSRLERFLYVLLSLHPLLQMKSNGVVVSDRHNRKKTRSIKIGHIT